MLRIALAGLLASALLAAATWLASLRARDVSLVDRVWSWMVAAPALVCVALRPAPLRIDGAGFWMQVVLLAWAVRLSVYVTARNHGHGEDRRYAAIRARNGPSFPYLSLVTVFGLQALLAWLVSMPVVVALAHEAAPSLRSPLVVAGLLVAATGVALEAIADAQMSAWRAARRAGTADPAAVMDSGLWRWSRHPNYFGEACVWWGLWLAALGAADWAAAWSIVSPLVMTVLLWRVSGVALLERDLIARKPAYRAYVARTSALVPWPPRPAARPEP